MRHIHHVSVLRAQTDEEPTDEEREDFLVLFFFRWIVALIAVVK